MAKHSSRKPNIVERIGTPIMKMVENKPAILCPNCKPSHPLSLTETSACGTRLQVRTVQTVYKAKYHKEMVCVKCQQGGGDMVMFNNAFVHSHDCTPGVATLVEKPAFSKTAQLVFNLPAPLKRLAERRWGQATPVDEVTPTGERTGVKLGYFFHKAA